MFSTSRCLRPRLRLNPCRGSPSVLSRKSPWPLVNFLSTGGRGLRPYLRVNSCRGSPFIRVQLPFVNFMSSTSGGGGKGDSHDDLFPLDSSNQIISGFVTKEDAMEHYVLDEEDFESLTQYLSTHPDDDDGTEAPLVRYRRSEVALRSRIKWKDDSEMKLEKDRRSALGGRTKDVRAQRQQILDDRRNRRVAAVTEDIEMPIKKHSPFSKAAEETLFTSLRNTFVIVIIKGVAAFFSGSKAMTIEAGRALFEGINQVFYYHGYTRSTKPPSRMHPHGYVMSVYVNCFMSSIFLTVWGFYLFGITARELFHPGASGLEAAHWAAAVLGVSVALDLSTLRVAFKEAEERCKVMETTKWKYLNDGPDATTSSIILDEIAGAVNGVVAVSCLAGTYFTGDAVWDTLVTIEFCFTVFR
jgi:Co/Zn/Cd efflux system component